MIVPSGLTTIVPFEGGVVPVTTSTAPTGEVSFASTFTVTGVLALVVAESSSALGDPAT